MPKMLLRIPCRDVQSLGRELTVSILAPSGTTQNNNTGRDHHPFAFSVFMADGGIRGGQVCGETEDIGWGIADTSVHTNDLHPPILHLFGMDHLKLGPVFRVGISG